MQNFFQLVFMACIIAVVGFGALHITDRLNRFYCNGQPLTTMGFATGCLEK